MKTVFQTHFAERLPRFRMSNFQLACLISISTLWMCRSIPNTWCLFVKVILVWSKKNLEFPHQSHDFSPENSTIFWQKAVNPQPAMEILRPHTGTGGDAGREVGVLTQLDAGGSTVNTMVNSVSMGLVNVLMLYSKWTFIVYYYSYYCYEYCCYYAYTYIYLCQIEYSYTSPLQIPPSTVENTFNLDIKPQEQTVHNKKTINWYVAPSTVNLNMHLPLVSHLYTTSIFV